ncbi:hypothetical protein BGX28_000400 [Mortierella sp. GBA30]|nr:hypothetical protein BGX28_000400 [Mortierella sp. GBA30]
MSLDGFNSRKKAILIALNSDTPDKSPKGYVDEPLLPLIVLINNHEDYVTTSSCSGRICTYLEGLDESLSHNNSEDGPAEEQEEAAGHVTQLQEERGNDEEAISKGYEENTSLAAVEAAKRAKGGQWLFVTHDPVVFPSDQSTEATSTSTEEDQRWIIDLLFGPEAHRVLTMEDSLSSRKSTTPTRTLDMARSQLVYFKFEPMILHIEASTPTAAKTFLNHSLFSGYRNSGILPSAKRTMLAIRSTLKLDAPVAYIIPSTSTGSSSAQEEEGTGGKIHLMVSLTYLRLLIELSNDKFKMNVAQMARFEKRLTEHLLKDEAEKKKLGDQGEWEDKEARRERKRKEGLLKKELAAKSKAEVEVLKAVAQEEASLEQ